MGCCGSRVTVRAAPVGREPAVPLRGRDGAERAVLPHVIAAHGAGAAAARGELDGMLRGRGAVPGRTVQPHGRGGGGRTAAAAGRAGAPQAEAAGGSYTQHERGQRGRATG